MPDRLRVSVALCTRNGAAFIERQLGSILNQTTTPDEIVLSDDASSDGTVELARAALAARAGVTPELIVLRNESPLGVTANFEQALAATSGDLVALCDQDDVWHPDRLAVAVAAMTGTPELLAIGSDARLVDSSGRDLGRTLFADLGIDAAEHAALRRQPFQRLLRRNLFTGATLMVRRSLFERARPFPPDWLHDEWLAVVGATSGGVDLLEVRLIDYRQHGSNAVGVVRPTLRRKIARALEPRAARNATLLARSRVLAERVDGLTTDPDLRAAAIEKARFEEFRSELPRHRLPRLLPVLRRMLAGDYGRFASQGRVDVIRDVLQAP